MFSTIGYIHLACAVISMITGLVVVFNTKGTKFHKIIGYMYVSNMLLMNITSFLYLILMDLVFSIFLQLLVS